jgi:hypothetical protein
LRLANFRCHPQTGAIDDIHKATARSQNPEEAAEGKKITEAIATLKYELQHNRKLTYVEDMVSTQHSF